MKKKIAILFLTVSAFAFAGNKYNVEELNFKEKNSLFYKEENSEEKLLNEEVEIYSKENLEVPIFKINFKAGEIKEIIFSNKNTYFSPQNSEEKFNFAFKRMNKKNFSGSLKYSKNKAKEMKKEEKTENTSMTFFSSASASSMMSYSGDFSAKEIEEFLEKFINNKGNKKVILKKSDAEELMSKN